MASSNSSRSRLNLGEFLCFVTHIIASLARDIAFDPFEHMDLDIPSLSGLDTVLRTTKLFGNNHHTTLDSTTDHLQSITSITTISSTKDLISVPTIDSTSTNVSNPSINIINPNSPQLTSMTIAAAPPAAAAAAAAAGTTTTSMTKITISGHTNMNVPPVAPVWRYRSKALGTAKQRRKRIGWKYACGEWPFWRINDPTSDVNTIEKFGTVWSEGRRRSLRLSGGRIPPPSRLMIEWH